MVRVNSFNRDHTRIPEFLSGYCSWVEEQSGYSMDINSISSKNIVVCTLSVCGKMFHNGITEGIFTHVVIDEVGQATEQETLLSFVNLFDPVKSNSRLILAGDPKQLGPILQSNMAKTLHADCSFMERLIKSCPLYARNDVSLYLFYFVFSL